MLQFSQIDQNRFRIREMKFNGDDHALLLQALNHATELRNKSESALRQLEKMK